MAIRVYKPTTAGRRNASVSDFSELTRSTPEKSLVRKLSKTGGRNSYGRMTSRHRGGGHKRQYRLLWISSSVRTPPVTNKTSTSSGILLELTTRGM